MTFPPHNAAIATPGFEEDGLAPLTANTSLMDNPAGRVFGSTAATSRRNMLLLIQLRWIAVFGQVTTIAVASFGLGLQLPWADLLAAPAILVIVNLLSSVLLPRRVEVANAEIFLAMMIDIIALTWQLYLSGGITNPFISLFLLQVVLGAVLLETRLTWLLTLVACLCFAFLGFYHRPLHLPPQYSGNLFALYLKGSFVCFVLVAVLFVLFVTRIARNMRALDRRLAALRQHAAEEELIVRMGWLASEAAHELGTPLSSLSVILNDWRHMPGLTKDADMLEEIEAMQAEVLRCKSIVTGILLSAGEARGDAPKITTLRAFLNEIADEWRASRTPKAFFYRNDFTRDSSIISDSVLKKVVFNVLDNALDASPDWVELTALPQGEMVLLHVTDKGPGFAPGVLEHFGKPYLSSKGMPGRGLGLFLVVNVVRKLGGFVSARNRLDGGAVVTLHFPLPALSAGEGGHG